MSPEDNIGKPKIVRRIISQGAQQSVVIGKEGVQIYDEDYTGLEQDPEAVLSDGKDGTKTIGPDGHVITVVFKTS